MELVAGDVHGDFCIVSLAMLADGSFAIPRLGEELEMSVFRIRAREHVFDDERSEFMRAVAGDPLFTITKLETGGLEVVLNRPHDRSPDWPLVESLRALLWEK